VWLRDNAPRPHEPEQKAKRAGKTMDHVKRFRKG
jgi:hypothetical protein